MKPFPRGRRNESADENMSQNILYSFSKKLRSSHLDKSKTIKDKGTFIDNVNGYIETITAQHSRSKNKNRMKKSSMSAKQQAVTVDLLREGTQPRKSFQSRVKIEKEINKNLQKCIMEIQKMLWDRNERLEVLEQELGRRNRRSHKLITSEEDVHSQSSQLQEGESRGRRNTQSSVLKRIMLNINNQEVAAEHSQSCSKSQSQISSQLSSKGKAHRPRTQSGLQVCYRKRRS